MLSSPLKFDEVMESLLDWGRRMTLTCRGTLKIELVLYLMTALRPLMLRCVQTSNGAGEVCFYLIKRKFTFFFPCDN